MKYCLVTETYPPEVNGVAMTLQRLAQGLACRDHEVSVVRPRQNRGDHGGVNASVREFTMPGAPLPRYPGLHFGLPAKGKLQRLWREQTPDLVHVATEGPLGLTAIWAARALKIPVISTFHTNFHSYGEHYGYGVLKKGMLGYLRYVHNLTVATYPPSRDLVERLEQDGFRNLRILGRGVDTVLFDPQRRSEQLRAEWGADPDDPVALYVGRVADEKNIPLTVETFRLLQADLPALKLVIVGDGPARQRLEKQHPDIHFAGLRQGEELARHYASADLFLFASTTETFGNVVTEAMASSLLVLTYDYAAGRRYIRNGENGFVAPFNDPAAFRQRASDMLQCREDWPTLRQAARETALALSWERIFEEFESSLQEFLPAPA